MSALIQQLEQLKQQQQELEERIQKEKESKQKLENESSIERLEALVQPLTDKLERRECHGHQGNVPIWDKSERDKCTIKYKNEMQKYNDRLIRDPRRGSSYVPPPQKNNILLQEEIYTTIISIFKKQQKEIDEIKNRQKKIQPT